MLAIKENAIIFISDNFNCYERMGIGRGGQIKCGICCKEIKGFKYAAMPQWNISGYLCGACYSEKLSEHYIKHKVKDK